MALSLHIQRQLHSRKLAAFQFEEAAFLSEQRIHQRAQGDFDWRALESIERRIENQIRALRSAPSDLMRDLSQADLGEYCVRLRIHAYEPTLTALQHQLAVVETSDVQRIQLAAEALLMSQSHSLTDIVKGLLRSGTVVASAVAALLLGHHREGPGSILLPLANDGHPALASAAIWALGRCASSVDAAFLRTFFEHADSTVREQAGIALLRLGRMSTRQFSLDDIEPETLPVSVLALSATPHCIDALRAGLIRNRNEASVKAVAIAGDVSSIPLLVDLLSDEDLGKTAAHALHLMTGAGLRESVWIADKMASAELFEDEQSRHQADGLLPTRADGQPFGYTVTALSQDPEIWFDWISRHENELNSSRSIRLGFPASAAASLQTLNESLMPIWARRAAVNELVARHHIDVPLEVVWPVHEQAQALEYIGQSIP